jgi:hypothetical protein
MPYLMSKLMRAVAAAGVVGFLGLSLAQDTFSQQPPVSPQLGEMTKRYKLDKAQQSEIGPILSSEMEDLSFIAGDSQLLVNDRKARTEEVRRVCNREIMAVLHEQQRSQFERDQH